MTDKSSLDWRDAVSWYDQNAAAFEAGALALDTSPTMARFVRGLPAGGRILDLGCGAGRDARAFLDLGFEVEAVDPSREMCRATARNTDHRCKVRQGSIQDVAPTSNAWDGIWMMASLLHVPRADWRCVLGSLTASLSSHGRLFVAVKSGSGEALDERGRPMSYASTEALVAELEASSSRPAHVEGWTLETPASNGASTSWANAILTL